MAVFTEIFNAQLDELLSHYDIGQARSLKGIASGIENSNFYLDTDKGKYVLTIFERLNKDQLPYYLELTSHLGKKGLAVSYPIPRKDGGLLFRNQRKALLNCTVPQRDLCRKTFCQGLP